MTTRYQLPSLRASAAGVALRAGRPKPRSPPSAFACLRSRQSRILQEAQDYAERLLQPKFDKQSAKAIARDLVTNYPTHQFCIDREEAKRIGVVIDEETGKAKDNPVGLHVEPPPPDLRETFDWLALNIDNLFVIGKVVDSPKTGASP
jgi:hypothetical protein